MRDKQYPSDAELFLAYARKHGFEDTYAHFLSMHSRGAADQLELLVKARDAHKQFARGSIDDVVTNDPSLYQRAVHAAISMPKAIVKGTWYAIKTTKLYLPFVAPIAGALPAKQRNMIAQRLGDNPKAYTWTNITAESIAAGSLAAGWVYQSGIWHHPCNMDITCEGLASVILGTTSGALWLLVTGGIRGIATSSPSPSLLYTIPHYTTTLLYSITKGIINASTITWKKIGEGYAQAWHEETARSEKTTPALPVQAPQVRIDPLPDELESLRMLIRIEEARIRTEEAHHVTEEANQGNEPDRTQAKT